MSVISKVTCVKGHHPEIEEVFEKNLASFCPSTLDEKELWKFYKCLQVLTFRYPEDEELQKVFFVAENRVKIALKNSMGKFD